MTGRHIAGFSALSAAAVLVLAACGSSTTSSSSSTVFGQAESSVVNPSNTPSSGTLTYNLIGTPDSTDPQNTYYVFMWNFLRTYTMQLLTYKSCPGACGETLVPQLATGLGTVSNNGLIWTYHIKPNVEFQNGQAVTAQDVKYGIERSYAQSVLPNGPVYYQRLLADPTYPGPYVNPSKNLMGLTSISTPNSATIQFHLLKPFSDFNYVVAIPQSTPVQPSWDSGSHGGANYQLDPESTGPYEFQRYALNRQIVLVKNPHWNPATDPEAKQLVNKIVVDLNVNPNSIDNNLLSNLAQVDMAGTGVQTAARATILSSPSLKAQADDPLNGFLRFAYINLKVIPNVHCREAIEFAANKIAMQTAYGGPLVGGDIAATVMPPTVIGFQKFDMYGALSMPGGDLTAAKDQLKACGLPNGFTTGIAYRVDRPQEELAARALQRALSAVGIKCVLDGFSSGTYYIDFAGVPSFARKHDIGISFGGWAADWPDGYGSLYAISDGAAIAPTGNANISEINNPRINGMFTAASNDTSVASRTAIWSRVDRKIMAIAAILPVVYQKVLLFRNPNLTNVYVSRYYGMYNYAVLGLK